MTTELIKSHHDLLEIVQGYHDVFRKEFAGSSIDTRVKQAIKTGEKIKILQSHMNDCRILRLATIES